MCWPDCPAPWAVIIAIVYPQSIFPQEAWSSTHTHRHRHTQTHTDTDTDTHKHTHTHTHTLPWIVKNTNIKKASQETFPFFIPQDGPELIQVSSQRKCNRKIWFWNILILAICHCQSSWDFSAEINRQLGLRVAYCHVHTQCTLKFKHLLYWKSILMWRCLSFKPVNPIPLSAEGPTQGKLYTLSPKP